MKNYESINEMRERLKNAQQVVKGLEVEILQAEKRCIHHWSQPVEAHIHHEGYEIPGDEPGTMGSDWRGPVYVSPRTELRWKRGCHNCGKIEFSSQVKEETVVKKSPVFPTV